MSTPFRLSKTERESLREAFRSAAWLEPSSEFPNDPEKSEWAAFEDDALFRMVPAFEALMEARAAANTGDDERRPGEPSTARRQQVRDRLADSPFAAEDRGFEAADEPVSPPKPGESFGDFLTDIAAPIVGDLAGIFVGGFGTRPGTRAPKPPTAADLLTGLLPTGLDLINDLLDPQQRQSGESDTKPGKPIKPGAKPGQAWKDAGADTP